MEVDVDKVATDLYNLVLIDVSQITEAYSEVIERMEMVRSVASGEPACFVYDRLRRRRPVGP